MPTHAGHLEQLCVGRAGFTSTGATCGEIYLFGMLYQATVACGSSSGGSEPGELFGQPCPRLRAWFDGMLAKPAVQKVLAGQSGAPGSFKLRPYFVAGPDYAAAHLG